MYTKKKKKWNKWWVQSATTASSHSCVKFYRGWSSFYTYNNNRICIHSSVPNGRMPNAHMCSWGIISNWKHICAVSPSNRWRKRMKRKCTATTNKCNRYFVTRNTNNRRTHTHSHTYILVHMNMEHKTHKYIFIAKPLRKYKLYLSFYVYSSYIPSYKGTICSPFFGFVRSFQKIFSVWSKLLLELNLVH